MIPKLFVVKCGSLGTPITRCWFYFKGLGFFHPDPWGNAPIWRASFSNRLKPPPRQLWNWKMAVYLNEKLLSEGPMFHFHDYGRKGYVLLPYDSQNARYTSTIDGCILLPIDRATLPVFLLFNVDWKQHVGRIKQCKSWVLVEWLLQSRACKTFFLGGWQISAHDTHVTGIFIRFYLPIKESHSCNVNMVIWCDLKDGTTMWLHIDTTYI